MANATMHRPRTSDVPEMALARAVGVMDSR
jgi:hypothetical protein